jgi:2-phospho-L-lactate transferase/gluconeogenesis factor (CofD/UPF0052 family)
MSTITTTSKSLFNVLRPLLPMSEDAAMYQVRAEDGKVEIQVIEQPESSRPQSVESVEERRKRILNKLHRRTVRGVGLSDYAVSRESMYSEDN